MKLVYAYLTWLVMGAVLATGIVLAVKGNPWLLIIGAAAFLVAFAKIGCLHH
ncbi:MAG TPA: hypothetical protein VJW76_04425 [Verrucomicrobiae bacterium]|nr:hypothetical protein [Verrucomicrobiae bacterium]